MRKIPFTKMEGAGNDFIIINALKINIKKLAVNVCDRKIGIGADGLLVCDRSKSADYKMRIINADGSEAEMCGNGVRCTAAYIVRNKSRKGQFSIETIAGNILVRVKNNVASARLSNPRDYKFDIPILINNRKLKVNYIDTGVPHVVVFVDNIGDIDVNAIGREIRHHGKFSPRGTNVNFVEQVRPNFVKVRTYERGVEGETRACGTGSVASAIISFIKSSPEIKTKNSVSMNVLTSGLEKLNITFNIDRGKAFDAWLKGNVNFIARGEYYVK